MTPASLPQREFYQLDEITLYLGISRPALDLRLKTGKLPSLEREGLLYIHRAEVEKLYHRLADPLYSTHEAAAFLSLESQTLVKKLQEEQKTGAKTYFPGAFKLFGGHWRIPESDLIKLREAQQAERKPQAEATPVPA